MPKHSDSDYRRAIDQVAKRIQDTHRQQGRDISHEQAKQQARKHALRRDRANNE